MRVRDIDTIEAMHNAALVLVPMLRRVAQYRSRGDTQVKSGVPLEHSGIGRLELGMALREAGAVREYAISLAVASLMVEALQPQASDWSALLALLATSTFGNLDVSQAGFRRQRALDDGGSTPVERVLASLPGSEAAEAVRGTVEAATALREAISIMALDEVHKEAPLLNGKDIKKVSTHFLSGLPFNAVQFVTVVLTILRFKFTPLALITCPPPFPFMALRSSSIFLRVLRSAI
jgi:hypothetical protein